MMSPQTTLDHAERESRSFVPARNLLLALVLFGMAGLALELFLLEHMETWQQWVPFVVLAAGFLAGVALGLRPAPATVRIFQAMMVINVITAVVGLYLHFEGNASFEQEMDASTEGLTLLWRSLRGATPALAPGAMAQLGLLGLILAYRHPASINHGETHA
jgi:hypothetical protein